MKLKKHFFHNILAITFIYSFFITCTKEPDNADPALNDPKLRSGSAALSGFNEMFSLSHLWFVVPRYYSQHSWVMEGVPQNMPELPATKAADLLYNFEINGRRADVFRDILALKTIEPTEGFFPFDTELFSVLQKYQQRNVELILAFSKPYPSWIDAKVQSLGGGMAVEMDVIANVISYFLARQRIWYGLDSTWMAEKLKVEPMNEFNAFVIGYASYAALLDNAVNSKLDYFGVPRKEVLASSIISGDEWQYLDWWTNYYQAGGSGTPNIHLYSTENEGIDINSIMTRWESVVARLQDPASLPNHNRIVIGEIGFPRAGLGDGGSAAVHASFFNTIYNSSRLQSVNRIMYWRIFSDWLSIDCTDGTCDPVTARETTFGYINYRTNTPETQMMTRFFPYGFWWTHQ